MAIKMAEDTLRVDAIMKALQEQREAALNDVCRLRGEMAVLRRDKARLEDELKAAKKPNVKPGRPPRKKA